MSNSVDWNNIHGLVKQGEVILPETSLDNTLSMRGASEIDPRQLLLDIRHGYVTPPRANEDVTLHEIDFFHFLYNCGLDISAIALILQRPESFVSLLCGARQAGLPHSEESLD